MGDNRETGSTAPMTRTIGGFDARCEPFAAGDARVVFWRVADLERHVDRDALLRADDPPEPPYWAHCWSGARLLAAAIPPHAGRVLELGCGLGLPGIVAARGGATVLFVDREAAPLSFVRESLRSNGLSAHGCLVGDATRPAWRTAFDVVLAAEILYDRAAFPALVDALAASLAPGGRVLLADGNRIDTRAFYALANERIAF